MAKKRSPAGWKRQAVRRMERSRALTLAFLLRLPPEDVRRARTQGAWSIKDILAHVAAWEDEGAKRLALITRGHADRLHFFDDVRETDRFNARAVAAGRRLSLPAMLHRLERARQRLLREIDRLPVGALDDPAHAYPVFTWLPEFAWTHEQAHLAEMKGWWTTRAASGRARRA